MTVTINGTTGIAGVDGSAATPAVQGADTNTGVFYGTDIVAISTGGTERVRVNASGQAEFTAGTAALPAITATGNTNTGVYFPAADQVGLTAGGSQVLLVTASGSTVTGTESVSGNLSFNSGYGSAEVAYGCRAWVNFNGTTNTAGFCTIRGSGNVTSVADNGLGLYTINFATAMPDVNYSTVLTPMQHTAGTNGGTVTNILTQTVSVVTISNSDTSGNTYQDSSIICAAIFR